MKKDLKEKAPLWFPIAPIMVVLCIALQNPTLGMMSIVGGFVYMVSLIAIGVFFFRQPVKE